MAVDLRLMRYVIAIADTGSFQAAAARLHMSQPPLSRQIGALERELGLALFLRRPTRLTAAGEVFVAEARDVLHHAERAVARTRQAARAAGGAVRVAYGPSVAHAELPQLIAALARRHPAIRVATRETWDAELPAALADGAFDLAIGRYPPVPDGWVAEVLREEECVVVVRAGHRLAARPAVALSELRGETFRFLARELAPGYVDAVLGALRATGETFPVWENPVPGLRHHREILRGGFMLLPRSVAEHLLPTAAHLPVSDPLPRVPLALVRPRGSAPPAVAALVRTARELAAREGWLAPAAAPAPTAG
ncbi:LysR family transcriptional regulator [Streptomyces radicis]|uniref:LysR family transcriptional regulator n=1 Tax=Streptomyces radicis TaxID=1750517 RepID=A0A3A9WHW3_9ACTN|nr:LysR family transcriptional regulator [Streptomyces radicis]RKN11903.1 LysR family transcriptional regulator [Streptomyces radicis]RKN26047.1 LysR family transcriptional regulator [Streptomyces radicis]